MNKGTKENAMKGMYELGKTQGDLEVKKLESEIDAIREESYAKGILDKIKHDEKCNEMLKWAVLYRVKQNKEYKKGGMTWEEFCKKVFDEPDKKDLGRNVNRNLKDIGPIVDAFSDKLSDLAGVPFNEIRYLGRSISDKLSDFDGEAIIYEGRKVPITRENAEDIRALVKSMRDSHRQEKEKLESKIDRLEKSKNQIINEEIDGLKREKKCLIDENERLKKFDIEGKDLEWSLEQAQEIAKAAHSFCVLCRKFIMDDRLEDDIELQAKVEGSLAEARTAILSLNKIWDDRFNSQDDTL